jgi:hypothetical protein
MFFLPELRNWAIGNLSKKERDYAIFLFIVFLEPYSDSKPFS